MKNKKNHVIVIGRQFGSGGREIGRMLAQKLDIPYYDRELLSEAAKRLGFRHELFEKADERRPSPFRALFDAGYGSPTYGLSSLGRERLYLAQSEVIGRIAAEGPCVIVGRTADYILRDDSRLTSIFLHSDDKTRAKRIIRRHDCIDEETAIEMAKKRDRHRENYYNYFTGRKWGYSANYHLTLDVSYLSVEEAVRLILQYLELKDYSSINTEKDNCNTTTNSEARSAADVDTPEESPGNIERHTS